MANSWALSSQTKLGLLQPVYFGQNRSDYQELPVVPSDRTDWSNQ